jgi:hypothetical protein
MTDTYTPRRPLVPGPPSQSSIAAKAVALREAQRPAQEPPKKLPEPVNVRRDPLLAQQGPVGQLTKAVASVMRHVGTIQKTGYNDFHKYRYPKMDDILVVVSPLMGENGLMILQDEISKEILEGNRLAVTYEFVVCHESGETTRPVRHTGMCAARDRKGNWDDKAVAKCFTNARKYHMMALFEVPTGDIEDNEPEDANQRQEQRPVPGPKSVAKEEAPAPTGPHKIVLGPGAGADVWASAYLKEIDKAQTKEELNAWDKANDGPLQAINDGFPAVYEKVAAAFERRLNDLGAAPPTDTTELMNWVASKLQNFTVYEEAEQWWNEAVAPREKDFDQVDWEMLLAEWGRTEQRLLPAPEEPGTA